METQRWIIAVSRLVKLRYGPDCAM